jgi:phosphoribosylaminoimidazole-succinocarboxamide synthase
VPDLAGLTLEHYPLLRSGKVRDIYDAGDNLLLVASDRLSAFDVILPTPIPGKGKILTAISAFWFEQTQRLCPSHLVSTDVSSLDLSPEEQDALRGRTMIARKAERIDIECVVRGYLAGSGYKEYSASGTLAGEPLPDSLRRGDRLPEPRFTPAIKNDEGHDENISRERLREIVGAGLAAELEATSLAIFAFASERAARAGLILADTKFEFGWIDGQITLIDEALTPDSSRYWDAAAMRPGAEPPSFDKQIVRDWLETQPWDKTYPGPEIPDDIVALALDRYQQVYDRLITTNKEPMKTP